LPLAEYFATNSDVVPFVGGGFTPARLPAVEPTT
jgi:hypothetical protein